MLAVQSADLPVQGVVMVIGLLVISLGIHECAHAWVALKRGDTTARDMGRLTLNPIAHIDPFMTLILPAFLYFTTGFIFGGAKPVPVVASRLKHPLRDMVWVALAGPVSNLLLAMLFFAVWRGLAVADLIHPDLVIWGVLEKTVLFNLVLAVFNMIPVPPLDGSRVLTYFLPPGIREPYVALEQVGFFLVIALLWTGVLWEILGPGVTFLWGVMEWVVTLGGLW